MKNISLFIAWRYTIGSHKRKNIVSMMKICFLSIFIGSFSLALVMAIMNGFEKVTHEKMQGIHAQIIMRAFGQELDVPRISKALHETPGIHAFSPTALRQAIIQAVDSNDITNIIMLKAIDPKAESCITSIEKKIITPRNSSLTTLVHDDYIAIGNKLAEHLGIKVGDTITILFAQDEKARRARITLGQSSAKIGGIFSTGIDEFDTSLALCSFNYFNTLFPEQGIGQINIKLSSDAHEDSVIKMLKKKFEGLEIYSWKDLYPALVAALKLEKYAMFLILALITLVASMNIMSLLFMQITQKKGDIAILQAMGMSQSSISNIFLYMGMSISFFASLAGLACATLTSWILQTYPFITLPDAYYVSHLPAHMEWHLLLIVFAVIMGISFISTWLPARRTKLINIAHVLRFEA